MQAMTLVKKKLRKREQAARFCRLLERLPYRWVRGLLGEMVNGPQWIAIEAIATLGHFAELGMHTATDALIVSMRRDMEGDGNTWQVYHQLLALPNELHDDSLPIKTIICDGIDRCGVYIVDLMRAYAARNAGAWKHRVVEVSLQSNVVEVRRAATHFLVDALGVQAEPQLVSMLSDRDVIVQSIAVKALARLHTQNARDAVMGVLKRPHDRKVHRSVERALGNW